MSRGTPAFWRLLAMTWLLVMLAGCAYRTKALMAEKYPGSGGAGPGYRFQNLVSRAATPGQGPATDPDELFVCLTFSGGGTRAAALAYGAMLALRQARIDWPQPGKTLLDEVDCISSVSGGSFTAAYYGLFRDRIFQDFERRFLRRDIQGALALRVLSPWNWPQLLSPYYSRIDLAADLYDDQIFEHKKYDDLLANGRPYVILNATNIGTGNRFPFTQDQFDLIGSDLGDYHVARGVAASSAFPFLLSPLALQNHQPLPGFPRNTHFDLAAKDYYVNREEYYWAQSERSYVDQPKPYVHLLDGGLADNVGLRPIINASEQVDGFINQNLGRMRRLAIIAVNARTESTDTISRYGHTPHIIPTVALATATTSMDNYSFATVDLEDRAIRGQRQARDAIAAIPGSPPLAAPDPYFTEVSFEAIPDEATRRAFYGIGTNFSLPDEQVTALISMGCELLKRDPTFRCLLLDIENEAAGHPTAISSCEDRQNQPKKPKAAEQIVCPAPGPWPPERAGQGAGEQGP